MTETHQEEELPENRFFRRIYEFVVYDAANWLFKRLPDSARKTIVLETPEHVKLKSTLDELHEYNIEMQETLVALDESSEKAELHANCLEDRLNESAKELDHAKQMKAEAEKRSKNAWNEMTKMRSTTEEARAESKALREDLEEARATLEVMAAGANEVMMEKLGDQQEAHERKTARLRTNVQWLSGVVSRLEAMEILYHDSLDMVHGLVLCVDGNNGVVTASKGFKKRFRVSDDAFAAPMPEDTQLATRPYNSKQSKISRPLSDLVANPDVVERFNEYASYFYPQLWDEPHFSMVLDFSIEGVSKRYLAEARILKKSVIVRDNRRKVQEERFAYAGARLVLKPVPSAMIKEMGEAILSYFQSSVAYATPKGAVSADDIDRAVRDSAKPSLTGKKELDILVDFSNAESVGHEAVKKVVSLYEFYSTGDRKEKYFIVPSRFRGQFFNAGLPPRAMLLPKDYKEKQQKPVIVSGAVPEQA